MKYITLILLLFTTNVVADDLKKAGIDLTKYYAKEYIKQHVDLNNNYLLYSGALINTLDKQEINISINDTKINLNDDQIKISKTWRF